VKKKTPILSFETFWKWLLKLDRDFLTLGNQPKTDTIVKTKGCPKFWILSDCNPPEKGRVRLGPSADRLMLSVIITTSQNNSITCGKDAAQATWHRYQGLRQAADYLQQRAGYQGFRMPHLMASSYVRANNPIRPYPHNWQDCPNPKRAPAFIAAAIRCYYLEDPSVSPCV
jgi:hypothetical protein